MISYKIADYPNHLYGPDGISFMHYFEGSRDWLKVPEPLLHYVKEKLPSYVKIVVNLGCASGRDFIPFQNSHLCVGFDITPVEKIKWVCDTNNLVYFQCSIQDFVHNIDIFECNWNEVLLYSCVSMIYASHEDQNRLIESVISKGCKNIVLQEYEPGNSGHVGYLNLNENNIKLFEKKLFRQKYDQEPMAHIMLDTSK